MDLRTRIRRRALAVHRKFRQLNVVLRGLADTSHPILAHLIPIRRCNLSCTYCNEFDQVSDPVPLAELERRVDRLAELGVSIITLSGGEPLLHPQIDSLLRHIRRQGVVASLITNGYLLTADRIRRLNDAGLEYMQISIDNVKPDDTSKKSLKVLDRKLELLAGHALFDVNINSVIGGGTADPEDAYTIGRRAESLGFSSTVGVIHDGQGQLRPFSEAERDVYGRLKRIGKRSYSRLTYFQDNLAAGKPNQWRCRAGARYLYICEDGLVHYCSQQRGLPGIPLGRYTLAHIRQAYQTEKPCAPNCTISCVHKVSMMDFWRDPQQIKASDVKTGTLVQVQTAD